jgi:hypothetical protein
VKLRTVLAVGITAIALTLAGALPASAAPMVKSFGDGGFPQISTDPTTGTSLIVYQQTSSAVFGVIVDKTLNVVRAPFLLSDSASEVQFSQPYAAWDPVTKSWLVAWDNDVAIYGRVVSAATGPQGTAAVLLSDHTQGDATQIFADIEQVEVSYSTSAHEFLAAFKARSTPSNCEEIFGVLVSPNGQPKNVSATTLSSAKPGNDDGTPGCDVDADNGLGLDYSTAAHVWFLGWYDKFNDLSVGRTVKVSGINPVSASTVTSLGANNAGGAPSITYDPVRHRFLALWWTDSGSIVAEANYASDAGVAIAGDAFAISTGSPTLQRPRAAYDPKTGNFVVMAHGGANPTHVYEQVLSPTSSSAGTFAAVDLGQRPSVAVTNTGCVLSVWQVPGASASGTSISATATTCPAASVTTPTSTPGLALTGVSATPALGLGGLLLILGLGALSIAAIARRRSRAHAG